MITIPIRWAIVTDCGPFFYNKEKDDPVFVYSADANSIYQVAQGYRVEIPLFEIASDKGVETILPKATELAVELAKVGTRELGPGTIYGILNNLETLLYAERNGVTSTIYLQRMGMLYAAYEFFSEEMLLSNLDLSLLKIQPPTQVTI